MTVSTDRWTCPRAGCAHPVVVVVGCPADTTAAIRAAQQRHHEAHAKAEELLTRIGMSTPTHPDPPPVRRRGRITRRPGPRPFIEP